MADSLKSRSYFPFLPSFGNHLNRVCLETHGCPHPRSITQRPHQIPPFTLPHQRLSGLLAWSRMVLYLQSKWLFLVSREGHQPYPKLSNWSCAFSSNLLQLCGSKHRHSDAPWNIVTAPHAEPYIQFCPLKPQCKQMSLSTAKEWWIKAYLPMFSNYLLVPKLQSTRTLKTKLSYSLNGYSLLIFLFLLHHPLYFKR